MGHARLLLRNARKMWRLYAVCCCCICWPMRVSSERRALSCADCSDMASGTWRVARKNHVSSEFQAGKSVFIHFTFIHFSLCIRSGASLGPHGQNASLCPRLSHTQLTVTMIGSGSEKQGCAVVTLEVQQSQPFIATVQNWSVQGTLNLTREATNDEKLLSASVHAISSRLRS